MEKIQGTQTEKNLWNAYAGESMATNKYLYFAEAARQQGYQQMAEIFEETAINERAHAKLWYEILSTIGTIKENLQVGIDGEHGEWSEMYPVFQQQAEEENLPQIAALFKMVADVEKTHEQRYQALLDNINGDTVYQKTNSTTWVCRNCGYVHEGPQALESCPICKKPKAYFQVKATNY